MQTDQELNGMIDRLGQEVARLQRAADELKFFRESYALPANVDLVAEFDHRGHRDGQIIQGLQVQLAHEKAMTTALTIRNQWLKEDIRVIQGQMADLSARAMVAENLLPIELTRIQKYMDGQLTAPAPRGLCYRVAMAIEGRNSVINELETTRAEAEALVFSHEGHISGLESQLAEAKAEVERLKAEALVVYTATGPVAFATPEAVIQFRQESARRLAAIDAAKTGEPTIPVYDEDMPSRSADELEAWGRQGWDGLAALRVELGAADAMINEQQEALRQDTARLARYEQAEGEVPPMPFVDRAYPDTAVNALLNHAETLRAMLVKAKALLHQKNVEMAQARTEERERCLEVVWKLAFSAKETAFTKDQLHAFLDPSAPFTWPDHKEARP